MTRPNGQKLPGEDTRPLAVTDLAVAAKYLGKPLAKVKAVAGQTIPYPDTAGTLYYSLAQLQRLLAGRPLITPEPNGQRVALTREDAEAAAILTESATLAQVADAAGVTVDSLRAAFRRYGLKRAA